MQSEPTIENETEKARLVADAPKQSPIKGTLVQFRVDDQIMSRLKNLADIEGSSPGMLCRKWALEKIAVYEDRQVREARQWHQARVEALRAELKQDGLYTDHPYFVLHAVPLSDHRTIAPERAQAIAGSLRPLADAYRTITGRFNHLGYESSVDSNSPAKIHLQVFRSGEIEALRPLWLLRVKGHDSSETVMNAEHVDLEIVDAASTACATLAGLKIQLPYMIFVTICGAKNSTMRYGYSLIQSDCFELPETEVKEWDQIAKGGSIEPMALTMREALNVLWNASGLPASGTFAGNQWLPASRRR